MAEIGSHGIACTSPPIPGCYASCRFSPGMYQTKDTEEKHVFATIVRGDMTGVMQMWRRVIPG